MGVSMIIIEDKIGLKKNSLFGTEVAQTQDSIEKMCIRDRDKPVPVSGKRQDGASDYVRGEPSEL